MAHKYGFTPILLAFALTVGCTGGSKPKQIPATPTASGQHRGGASPAVDSAIHGAGGTGSRTSAGPDLAQETPNGMNPSELRAKASPKTLEDVQGLSGYDEVQAKSQPSASVESVQMGKALYTVTCSRCHGAEGKAKDDSGTLGRYNMANLSDAMQYKYGADGLGIYRSLAYGTAAPPHGMYKDAYTEAQIWSLVAYVQTLQH